MPIVGGLDIHRRLITFDYLETETADKTIDQDQEREINQADIREVRPDVSRAVYGVTEGPGSLASR
jgi:hypothetical protein